MSADWAFPATASLSCFVPLMICPGGKAAIVVPGLRPTSPETVVPVPVFVIVLWASTANGVAAPNWTVGVIAAEAPGRPTPAVRTMAVTVPRARASNGRRRAAFRSDR